MGLVGPSQTVTLYQVGDIVEGQSTRYSYAMLKMTFFSHYRCLV